MRSLTHCPHFTGEESEAHISIRAAPGTNPARLAEMLLYPGKASQLELMEIILGFRNGLALKGDLTI